MTSRKRLFIGVFLLFYALAFFQSCAHLEPSEDLSFGAEIWEFETIGDTKGSYKMLLKRTKIAEDTYKIVGSFSGIASDYLGGSGMMDCRFSGKIVDNKLSAEISGYAQMMVAVTLEGDFWGILNDKEGLGEWKTSHAYGRSLGTWKMKRG